MYVALKEILSEQKDPSLLPLEIWVGDSHEIMRGVHKYLRRLRHLNLNLPPIVIFPGHPLQISSLANYIQMPTLLNCYRFRIKVVLKLGKKYHWLFKWIRRAIFGKFPQDRKYGYCVLNPDSSVGRKLRAKALTDEEAYEEITTNWRNYWEMVYIEGGSGNFENTVANRLKLVENVANFAHSKNALLIVGGGVCNKSQVEELKQAGADIIVVSSVLEKSEIPKTLMLEFLETVTSS